MNIGSPRNNISVASNHGRTAFKSKFLGIAAAIGFLGAASGASAGCLATNTAKCSAAINSSGLVGQTSYTTLPFVSSVYQLSWGSSPSLSPGNLFWQSGSNFTNPTTMANAQTLLLTSPNHHPCLRTPTNRRSRNRPLKATAC